MNNEKILIHNEHEIGCMDCGKTYDSFGLDVVLPHSQWKLIKPEVNGLLCAQCIINRSSKIKGAIVIHAFIEFRPPNTDEQ